MVTDVAQYSVTAGTPIRSCVARMDENKCGVMLVIDGDLRLTGIITDGDLRRAVLANVDFEQPVSILLAKKFGSRFANPITAPANLDASAYLKILKKNGIYQLPVVDQEGRLAGLVMMDDFLSQDLALEAVVMAGGFGHRLRPITADVPKPMLPIGDKPLLEHTIRSLRKAGIRKVNVTTHYKGELIAKHFGDGKDFGVEIFYVNESQPLGTAGALGLLGSTSEPLLVINGDIITGVDFRRMLGFHREHEADLTIAIYQRETLIPYGVVEINGADVVGVEEKPVIKNYINAGIYLLSPNVRSYVANGQPAEMPDLINRLILNKGRVVGFPIWEYWIDIGHREEYERAQKDSRMLRV